MYREHAPWRPLADAELSWGDGGAPRSTHYGDIYHSPGDGAAESRHVFLAGNDLPARWAATTQGAFRIGELGFGTGLNFLLTLDSFLATAPPGRRLHYWAVEHAPLRREDLRRSLRQWPALAGPAAALLDDYPPAVPGVHRLVFGAGRVTLDLCWADARAALDDLAGHGRRWFDAWYLDGFAPACNPALWEEQLWTQLARLSRSDATVATFSAAGAVRRGLASAGFAMHKRPGHGRKRECLAGVLARSAAPAAALQTPWDRMPAPATPDSALVIGAGIAGTSAAAALARRGLRVTVLDAGPIAGRASGNRQGVLYTRFSHRHAALTDAAVLSHLDARRRYRALFAAGLLESGRDGELAGAFQMAGAKVDLARLRPALEQLPELAEFLTPAEAAERLGVTPADAGLWLPHSGWLCPAAACHALLSHPLIEVIPGTGALNLTRTGAAWTAANASGRRWQADIAVIAAGIASGGLAQLHWLPLRPIRGQVTEVDAGRLPSALRAPFCHTGYAAPPSQGLLSAGATFAPDDEELGLREGEHRENLRALGEALPAWAGALEALPATALGGRAELRAASPDYLPLTGPVPDLPGFERRYASLARNARQLVDEPGAYRQGLYLSTGHGSRGLTSAPLAGEILASQACDEPPPLPRALLRAQAPARFPVRAIVRSGAGP